MKPITSSPSASESLQPTSVAQRIATVALATGVLVLAACTASKPAPIVNRTGPGSAPTSVNTPSVPRPPVVASVPTAPTPTPSDVQSAPVRTGNIDTKPLETKPLDVKPAPVVSSPSTVQPPLSPPSPPLASVMRTQPKGLKRPYSDTLLAELKAADAPPVVVAAVPTPAVTPTPSVDPKAAAASDPKAASLASALASQLAWPSAGKVIQSFGKDKSTGMVFSGKIGDPISAAADGKVIFSNTTLPQYGKMIIVKHDDDTHSVYAHNKTLLVKEGQSVKKGQKIAELGDSGATQPKLYFEVRKQGKPVDPQKLLAARP
jgi:lipoprotein NlpD